jgi:hypothetical protein
MFYEILKNEISKATVTHLWRLATNIPQNVGPNELCIVPLISSALLVKMQKKNE